MTQYQAELYHHGIKGQRWGIRRFQNADGTYTDAGKDRRNSSGGKKTKTVKPSEPTKNKTRYKKMSSEELQQRIERLKLEKEYLNLKKEAMGPGKNFVLDVMTSIGKKTLTQLGTAGVMELASKNARKRRTWRTVTDKDGNEKKEVDFDPSKFFPNVKDQW